MLSVDGSASQTVLPNLTPGVTYKVTVIAVKGQRESEPGSDTVTTGKYARINSFRIWRIDIKMSILSVFVTFLLYSENLVCIAAVEPWETTQIAKTEQVRTPDCAGQKNIN